MKRCNRILVLLLLVLVLGACQKPGAPAPGSPDLAVRPSPAVPQEAPELTQPPVLESDFGPHLTLAGLIQNAVQSQYFSWDSILKPPPESFAQTMLVQLVREPLTPFLAKGVTAFAGDGRGLAMALENGQIALYSQWPCPGVAAPQSSRELSWSPESRYLASLDQDGRLVRVFDLELCGEVARQDTKSRVRHFALSRAGTYLAVINEVHELYLAATPAAVSRQALLRYDALLLAFTPQEEVLLVVDQAGWMTLFESATGKELDRHYIGGGPYVQASLQGRILLLKDKMGAVRTMDVVTKQSADYVIRPDVYALDDGVLYYLSRQERYVKRVFLSRPQALVWYSAEADAFKVEDMDAKLRYYGTAGGELLDGAPGDAQDWLELPLAPDTGFALAGREYRLAEVIRQEDGLSLLCRHLPGEGYFLWWVKGISPVAAQPAPGALPRRGSILATSEISWEVPPGKQTQ